MVIPNQVLDRRFLDLAKHISGWSRDPSTKVGAVLVSMDGEIVGQGINQFPRGVDVIETRLQSRPLKYLYTVHAEVNAVLMAGERAKNSTLYIYPTFRAPFVCAECCKVLIQAGVNEIVAEKSTSSDSELLARWDTSLQAALTICKEAGIHYREIT